MQTELHLHFHNIRIASIKFKHSLQQDHSLTDRHAELIMFIHFVIRMLNDLGENSTSSALAKALLSIDSYLNIEDLISLQPPDMPELIECACFDGKRFHALLKFNFFNNQCKEEYRTDYTTDFIMKANGFGIFAKGIGYYAPVSVLLLLKYLTQKYFNDKYFIELLVKSSRMCAGAYFSGAINLFNHQIHNHSELCAFIIEQAISLCNKPTAAAKVAAA